MLGSICSPYAQLASSLCVCLQAAVEVNKALMLDYVAPEAEQQRFACERPLDRVLLPLQQVGATASQMSCLTHSGSGARMGNMHLMAPLRSAHC